MYEVELKVRADHDRVRERLAALGATDAGGVRQVDTGAAGDETTTKLTYKGPLVEAESKTRREHETAVDDAATEGILDGLGFEPAATVEKHRRFFEYDGYTVTLDDVDGLGAFVEVETEVETDVETAREGAAAVLADLGLDADEQIRTSYLGLLLADEDA